MDLVYQSTVYGDVIQTVMFNRFIYKNFDLGVTTQLGMNDLQDYSTDGMSQGLLIFLQHLREFGLVYQRKVCTFPIYILPH